MNREQRPGLVENVERKLAAILAADVVGYSRLTGADEEGTLRRLRALRGDLIEPTLDRHRGRVVKTMGDGFLIEFPSVVDAVRAAIEIQRGVAEHGAGGPADDRITLRVGVHLGDVVALPDGDLVGDGVNIAARLEGIAEPGGICISEDAYRQVRDRVGEQFVDAGEKELKNIIRPMRVYALSAERKVEPAAGRRTRRPKPERRVAKDAAATDAAGLPSAIGVSAPGLRTRLGTLKEALAFIDRHVPPELASRPRWTFARALVVEAMHTGKSRDVNTAARQLTQALRNERWLDEPST